MILKKIITLLILLTLSANVLGQAGVNDGFSIEEEDLNIGGDIFSNFNEDIESNQVMEDERFYRYGRFFTFSFALGLTSFTGNRGIVYENEHPSYGIQLTIFKSFQTAISLGIGFSRHNMYFDSENLAGFQGEPPGFVQVSQLRVYTGYKFYIDTANLGTAITYSNPYLTTRLEYWYTTNKFIDNENVPNRNGGGLGVGLGGGLEFPIKLKESYLGVEVLYHNINFFDKNTGAYKPTIDDLNGDAVTTMMSYIWNW